MNSATTKLHVKLIKLNIQCTFELALFADQLFNIYMKKVFVCKSMSSVLCTCCCILASNLKYKSNLLETEEFE